MLPDDKYESYWYSWIYAFLRIHGDLCAISIPVLSRFRSRLTAADAWDELLVQVNNQIQAHNITVRQGCHVDASITQSPRKPKTRSAYEVVSDREERDDEADARAAMRIIEVVQPGVDSQARWVRKGGKSIFGYKQHTVR